MTTLRDRLRGDEVIIAPGVYDGLSALVASQAGFEALYLSGASIAYTRFGRSDIGLVSMTEVADTLGAIRERVETPIIVDADTGFGNALNVQRTVRLFERNGATGIQLEDQASPKRCGHLDGKSLVPTAEMVGKIRAALDARRSEETLIVARTDAIAVEGFEAALERAGRYMEAGCDVLFVEAPRNVEEMRQVTSRFGSRVPLLANMVEGGKTPLLSASELGEIGYKLVIFPGGLPRALAHCMSGYFASLKQHGTTAPYRERMLDFAALNALIGTPELLERGRAYDPSRFEEDKP
ncbi:MAG TPA: isocitrate lyase/PEP mutase family protein [Ferrovibrio sp.]|jgi:2-methylisocitrate lyase-like PEP mutase family enzyme|uniref:isocitrate lyase/PEP mutase family protein n=1 Tax=Ferrovibrio sp. TaxID=1917215 RepID=UPI002B4B5975|nr:isocitrate lyase/PEP mutase family protein [Ferrovibrio sp.]HLT76175.1 isocitrate lyase/PEP mutase family protein [Ferrovibrio sp.]